MTVRTTAQQAKQMVGGQAPGAQVPKAPRAELGNKGRSFEEAVAFSNRMYLQQGRAVVHKIPTAWKPIRRGGQFVSATVTEKAVCDFMGVLSPSGRAVAFDTKECRQRSFGFSTDWAHEVEFMRHVERAGGIAFLLIEHIQPKATGFGEERTVYLVPCRDGLDRDGHEIEGLFTLWDAAMAGKGRKSISLEQLQRYPIARITTAIPVDWLDAVHQAGIYRG